MLVYKASEHFLSKKQYNFFLSKKLECMEKLLMVCQFFFSQTKSQYNNIYLVSQKTKFE